MAWLAAAYAAGLAASRQGVLPPPAPLLLALLLLPIATFLRPGRRVRRGRRAPATVRRRVALSSGLLLASAAGLHLGDKDRARAEADCRARIPDGAVVPVRGVLEALPPGDGTVPFRLEAGPELRCAGRVSAVLADRMAAREGADLLRPGRPVRGRGRWLRRKVLGAPPAPERSGLLLLDSLRAAGPPATTRDRLLALRGGAQEAIRRLFPRRAPLAEALVLARKEGLDPAVRERFARAGIAHLLAISGFHTGVVAGLLLALGLAAGGRRQRVEAAAAVGVWAYVLSIGAPFPALRAATILTLLLAGRLLRRPVHPAGALGTAALGILLLVPGAVAEPGFQLSFAAAGGLVFLLRPLRDRLLAGGRRAGRAIAGSARPGVRLLRRIPGPLPGRLPPSVGRGLAGAVAAGVAATLATAPLTAWHFGRVAPGGIVLTLVVGPVVAAAIPGIALSVLLLPVHAGLAAFVAGGADLLLAAAEAAAEIGSGVPGASFPVSRTALLAGTLGIAGGILLLRATSTEARRPARRLVVGTAAAAAILLRPALPGAGADGDLHLWILDVGQGDAIAVRSPRGRWLLVDAGPRTDRWDAGARVILPFLRQRGVRRLEALVLSHPDLDHIGGAGAVLDGIPVSAVLEPARPVGKGAYVALLEASRRAGVPWVPARGGSRIDFDGVEIEVLHPSGGRLDPSADANDLSAVLRMRWGRFDVLLPGDAPAAVELSLLDGLGGERIELLKVAHHGSATSTPWGLLRRIRPEAAVISVGRRNRYGHPAPGVLARLRRAGARIARTDRDGTVHVAASRDGRFVVETAAEAAPALPGWRELLRRIRRIVGAGRRRAATRSGAAEGSRRSRRTPPPRPR